MAIRFSDNGNPVFESEINRERREAHEKEAALKAPLLKKIRGAFYRLGKKPTKS